MSCRHCESISSEKPPAAALNALLAKERPWLVDALSAHGKRMYFPKAGILSQAAECKVMANRYNCSIGMATEACGPMHLRCVMDYFNGDKLTAAEVFPYAPPAGKKGLREIWQKRQLRDNAMLGQTSMPVVTSALTHALSVLGDLFVDAGDEIILPDQLWGNYRLIFDVDRGAKITTFPFFNKELTGMDLDSFEATIKARVAAERKKVIVILNFPNNPTGYTPTKAEALRIVKILVDAAEQGLQIVAISDDAYYGMFFDDECERSSIFGYLAGAHDNILACKVDGCTKEAFVWGFRVGFLTFGCKGLSNCALDVLEQKAMGSVRCSISNVSMPAQSIMEKVFLDQRCDGEIAEKVAILKARAAEVKAVAYQEKYKAYWDVYPFNSGYFMLIRVKGVDAENVRKVLLDTYQVGVIRTSPTDIRIAFSCLEKEAVVDVFESIKNAIDDLRHEYKMSEADRQKIVALDNECVSEEIYKAIWLCKPKEVLVFTDEDAKGSKQLALDLNEEKVLATPGHTIHYDSYYDQGRDKDHTKVLLPEGEKLSQGLNYGERFSHLREIKASPGQFMNGTMAGKTMIVRFFCLGPAKSIFSQCALQITDSAYVAHSEDILYRAGYEQFKRMSKGDDKKNFFCCIHSAGVLDERNTTSREAIPNRRIYIDPIENKVYSVNCQYAGNSLACKKLALRLAINKATKAGTWLTEHMFLSGFKPVTGPEAGKRMTYFTGAYPSACGKTSTAMIPGGSIVGDDIVYIRKGPDGEMRAVNIEQGVFGIIKDVNPEDDPEIYQQISTPREVIFSNVLVHDGLTYWSGMGKDIPKDGINHHGKWKEGDKDEKGNVVPPSHANSRFTVRIEALDNHDANLHNPDGVRVDAILYGGRDSDISVPVAESRSWLHGVFIGASILSKTTAATLGKAGVFTFNPMANIDFVIVPLGDYIANHLRFGSSLKRVPKVYATNYFLQKVVEADGEKKTVFLNTKLDKAVWVLWAEGRVHNEFGCVQTPIGSIPKYEDLRDLFAARFKGCKNEVYTKEAYNEQFSLRIDLYLEQKYALVKQKYAAEDKAFPGRIPDEFKSMMNSVVADLEDLRKKAGKGIVTPDEVMKLYPQE